MQLPQGAKVSGLRLTDRADGKVLGEARLAPNGSWTGSGRLDAATARRVAEAMAEVAATEFPTRDLGAGDWKYELRVTDQAAAGAGGAAESLRTYLLAAPIGAHNLLVRDDADTDAFLLAPIRADILIPLLEAGK
jgi:ABC-type phosphate/phosphonate transport system substrate-binding protein